MNRAIVVVSVVCILLAVSLCLNGMLNSLEAATVKPNPVNVMVEHIDPTTGHRNATVYNQVNIVVDSTVIYLTRPGKRVIIPLSSSVSAVTIYGDE